MGFLGTGKQVEMCLFATDATDKDWVENVEEENSKKILKNRKLSKCQCILFFSQICRRNTNRVL